MRKDILMVVILGIIIILLLGALTFLPAKRSSQQNPPVVTKGIQIISPKPNEEIFSPLKITGVVNGNGWSGFEGQVGNVRLLDGAGKELALGILTATTEWMKLPTNFETTLNFTVNNKGQATLVFHNENSSGDPAKDKTFSLPVKISTSNAETTTVKVYFAQSNGSNECNSVFAFTRDIPKTQSVAQAAINELLKGPTDAEKVHYSTSIPAGSKLNTISIINGVAMVDFNETTESGGGSCSMAARVAQITKTLMQFPTITSVKLSINGRTGDVFQP
jgi:hypothetical protein